MNEIATIQHTSPDRMSPGEWVERSKTAMAWAISASDGKATYIGKLPRERNGLACDCICPACGGILVAVKAGLPFNPSYDTRTLRPHFRHHVGQQSNGCLVRAVQVAALALLLEEDTIYLPAPTGHAVTIGASGELYKATAKGEGVKALITSREWVDETQAKITLADGRVVLICLTGSMAPSAQGLVDAVITIEVDDPEVSSWSPAEILERAQLGGDWLCWSRHWLDEELHLQAQLMANEEAERAMDRIPNDWQLPPGLTALQRSESVLHWHIKNELEAAATIRVPQFKDQVSLRMPNGETVYQAYGFEECTLRLSEVRLEQSLGGFVPDVMCTAQQEGSKEAPFPLLIEVAVTHRVDEKKLQKIKAAGLACLEVDVRLWRQSGHMRRDALRNMLLTEPHTKLWLNRPGMEDRRLQAMEQLHMRAQAMQGAQDKVKKRKEFFNHMDPLMALNARLRQVRLEWQGRFHGLSPTDVEDQAHLCEVLRAYGWVGLDDHDIVGEKGVLWCIEAIRYMRPRGPSAFEVFCDVFNGKRSRPQFITLIGAAITAYKPFMTPEETETYLEMKDTISDSFKVGNLRYARSVQFDAMISALHPEMEANLARGVGTVASVQKVGDKRRAAEMDELRKKQAEAQAEIARLFQQVKTADSPEQLDALINGVTNEYSWMPISGWPSSLEDTLIETQRSLGKSGTYNGVEWRSVVEAAWKERELGSNLANWFQGCTPTTTTEARNLLLILEKAWLINTKKKR